MFYNIFRYIIVREGVIRESYRRFELLSEYMKNHEISFLSQEELPMTIGEMFIVPQLGCQFPLQELSFLQDLSGNLDRLFLHKYSFLQL